MSPQHPSVSSICDHLVSKLASLWNILEPSLHLISKQQIKRQLMYLHSERSYLTKNSRSSRKKSASFDQRLSDFKAKYNLIFNICVCKCQKKKCTCLQCHKRFAACPGPSTSGTSIPDVVVI